MRTLWFSLLWMLRRSAVGLVSLLIGIAAFEMIQPVAIKSFGNLDRLQPFLELVPPSFWALMNVTPDFLGSVGLAGYLSLGYTHPAFLILSSTTVFWFGSRVLAGEMERGSIQYSLARPVSRNHFYLSRLIGTMIVTTLTAIAGPIGMATGMVIARPEGDFAFSHLFIVAAMVWALFWAVAGAILLCSASSSTMSRSIGIGIGLLVVSYVIDYFSALWTALEPLAPFSIFHYYEPSTALAAGTLSPSDMFILLAIGGVGAIAGYVVFVRRDLPV
jgi:ABC-2 type transport system permease protein